MTHMQVIAALVIVGTLAAIGWGVRRILQMTSFMFAVVRQNLIRASEDEASMEPQLAHDNEHDTKPLGFGVRLKEGK